MDGMRDPQLVWRFQRFFGVRKVAVVGGGGEGAPWVAAEANLMPPRIKQDSSSEEEAEKCNSRQNGRRRATSISNDQNNVVYYRITDQFWHLLFLLGSQLGDEELLGLYLSVWMWCLDSSVGRRIVLIWTMIMYLGQGLKDILRWPRPCMPTVVQLEKKWALEYGMPSTHAMVGLAVPVASIFYTVGRYDYPVVPWAVMAAAWCFLVCCSRLYLGMHSLADIVVGLLITPPLLLVLLPLVEFLDQSLVTSPWAPLLSISLSMLAVRHYPGSDRWTPARGDTTASLGVAVGVLTGHWVTFHMGLMCTRPGPTPYPVPWPAVAKLGTLLLRCAIGFVVFLATRAVGKPVSYALACAVLQKEPEKLRAQERDVRNRDKLVAELTQKYVTYLACGLNTVVAAPALFWLSGCGPRNCWTDW